MEFLILLLSTIVDGFEGSSAMVLGRAGRTVVGWVPCFPGRRFIADRVSLLLPWSVAAHTQFGAESDCQRLRETLTSS